MEPKNKRLLLLLIVPLVFWGVFLFFSEKSDSDVVIEGEETERLPYPEHIGGPDDHPNLDVAAAFSLYYNDEEEKVLYEENADEVFPIASISKLMTALVVFENYNLEKQLGVTEEEVFSRTEFRDFRAWRETEIEEVVHSMLVESNNSAAFALALISDRFLDGEGDSIEVFIEAMNDKAKEIGLKKTHFINSSGLDGREEYNRSTAKEIGLFSRYILKNKKEIFEISKMPSYRLYSPDGLAHYEVLNTNIFLHSNDFPWEEKIIGGKTGWTRAAFGCLLLVLEPPEGEGYIVNVVLGAEDRFKEMEKLVEYVYSVYNF